MTPQHGGTNGPGMNGGAGRSVAGAARSGSPAAGAPSPEQLVEMSVKHAELLAAQGRFGDALEALNPGLTYDPNHPHLLHTRAWLLINLWRLDEARVTLERLLGAHPDLHGSRRLLSITLMRQGLYPQAEREIDICLANDPSDPFHQLQRARVLIAAVPERRDKRKLKRAARRHIDQALAFAAGNPAVFEEATRALWSLGRVREALDIAKRGLAEAPQDAGLLALHADLVTANTPTSGGDTIHQDAVHAVEMGKLLAAEPQHREARTALFQQLWFRSMVRIDAPIYLTAVAALGLIFGFAGGTADPGGVALWWAVAGVFGGVQWLRFWAVSNNVPRGFRRSIAGSRPVDVARRWGERAVSILLVVAGVFAFVLALTWRDAVAVRWVVVLLCLLVLLSFACSLAWQLGYVSRARKFEGEPTDRDAVVRLAAHRRGLAALVVVRCLGAVGLWILFFVTYAVAGFAQSRDDVSAVVLLATSGMVLSPLIGWFVTWVAEQRARRELDAAITVDAKAPALWSPALGAVVAAGLLITLIGGVAAVPMTPNQHDAIGQYAVKAPRGGDDADNGGRGNDGESCSGTKAARLACQLRKLQERPQVEVPEIEPLDLPDIPEVTEIPVMPPLG